MSPSDALLIVAPYTEGTPYAEEAEELRDGAAKLGYRVEPIEIADQGDWRHNICKKPRAIFDRMTRHDGPVLVLDADCRVLRPLDELFVLGRGVDVMIKHREHYAFSALFNVGVIYFAATRNARMLAQTWAERTERHGIFHRFPDQATFSEAMLDGQHRLRFRPLPRKFHVEPRDADQVPEEERCIFHYKSSRAQRNARQAESMVPTPIDSGLEAEFVCLCVERKKDFKKLALSGAEGAASDFVEYTHRFGIDRVWMFRLPVAPDDMPALDHCRVFAWRSLMNRFSEDKPLVVADLNVLMLQSPRPWCELLSQADIVVAWDRRLSTALPSPRCIAMRTNHIVGEQLLPRLERCYVERRQSESDPSLALAQALGHVLAEPLPGLRVATLPADTIVPMSQATSQSQMILTDTEMSLTGEQSWHRPMFLRHPQEAARRQRSIEPSA